MTDWKLYDESDQVYTFPAFSLSPSSSVKVFSGKGSDDVAGLYIGRGSPVWNNDGDMATLRDNGGNVVSQRYG